MLKVKSIQSIWDTLYEGVAYPVIDALVCIDDSDVPETLSFGPESLNKALCPVGEPVNETAEKLDQEFYAYVADNLHLKNHNEIADWIEKEIE